MLAPAEREELLAALRDWARSAPPEPVFGFFNDEDPDRVLLTPDELVAAVEGESTIGQALLDVLEHGVRRKGLEAVLSGLRRPLLTRTVELVDAISEAIGLPLALGSRAWSAGDVLEVRGSEVIVIGSLGPSGERVEVVDRPGSLAFLRDCTIDQRGDRRAVIGLDSPTAWLIMADGYVVEHLQAVPEWPDARDLRLESWDPRWRLVTDVGRARDAVVVAARGRPASAVLGLDARGGLARATAAEVDPEAVLFAADENVMLTCRTVRLARRWRAAVWAGRDDAAERLPIWEPAVLPVEEALEALASESVRRGRGRLA